MLVDKLKIGSKRLFLINVPDDICNSEQLTATCVDNPDIAIGYIDHRDDFVNIVDKFKQSTPSSQTILNVIYTKLSNKMKIAGFNRDDMMELGKKFQLEACRLINVNDNYSCMGFRPLDVYQQINNNRPSQCVDDYIDKLPELINLLNEEARIKFNKLTIGYQKGWARYVFSALQEKTRQKRLMLTNEAISQDFKTIEQYQGSKK